VDSLLDALQLIFRKRQDDLHLQSAARRPVVEPFPQAHDLHAAGVEIRNRQQSVDETAAQAITRLRNAGVTQPITSIDTWWNWCNTTPLCQPWGLAADVDWVGINVHPWWENRGPSLYPCIPAADAPTFIVARVQELRQRYPSKEVVLTEFGWPAGPYGYTETHVSTGQQCGVASAANQRLVVEQTVALMQQHGWPHVVFAFAREPWKFNEGAIGPWWGFSVPRGPTTMAMARRTSPCGGDQPVSGTCSGVRMEALL
jgi:exo-beta-1,3-glucanase (GH17 family)